MSDEMAHERVVRRAYIPEPDTVPVKVETLRKIQSVLVGCQEFGLAAKIRDLADKAETSLEHEIRRISEGDDTTNVSWVPRRALLSLLRKRGIDLEARA